MKKDYKYLATKDNCLQCCLCYMLQQKPKHIIDVNAMHPFLHTCWLETVNTFLALHHNKILTKTSGIPKTPVMEILSTQGGKSAHARVLDKKGSVLWDPSPEVETGSVLITLELKDLV